MALTPEQVQLIKATVPIIRQHGKDITSCFYKNMLGDHPELNHIFNRTNQLNGHQASALADSLYAYASHIDDLGVLGPAVERIDQKHASLYVQPEQYDIVGTYLLKAMKEVLGDALTDDIHTAWAVAYKQLADIMIGREKQLYKDRQDWTDWRDFTIVDKIVESDEITSFQLKPTDGKPLPNYHPGQYVSIRTHVPSLQYLQSRQYSLSDAHHPDHYRISVKKELGLHLDHPAAPAHPGYVSSILHADKQIGDTLQVSHPAGEFYFDRSHGSKKPIVLISAGVGLTPMLSIIRTLDAQDSSQPISWIHGTRSSRVHAFKKDIDEIVRNNANVKAQVFMTHPEEKDAKGVDYQYSGRMSLGVLDKEGDLFLHKGDAEYYICGPERFMADMRATLVGFGVEEGRVKMEVFGTGAIPT